jgi:hypothetical protein
MFMHLGPLKAKCGSIHHPANGLRRQADIITDQDVQRNRMIGAWVRLGSVVRPAPLAL